MDWPQVGLEVVKKEVFLMEEEYVTVYTAYITVKGRRIYAKQFGLKCFCFTVKRKKDSETK